MFKALLPQVLRIELNNAEEGGYWAKTVDIPCYSQGETLSELFEVLTKAIYAFYDVPEKLIPELGTYLPVDSVRKSVSEQKPKKYTLEVGTSLRSLILRAILHSLFLTQNH